MRHNRLLLILLALNIGLSASLSQNVAYAQNIDSQSERSYFKNKWPGRAGMSEEVQAYALPNAGYIDVTGFKPEYFGLPKGSSGYAFLTRHFFERSGISTDSDYTDLPVLTYRYYQPKATQPADRLNRGGGRDVILMPTQDTEKLKGAIYTIKGSGTNSRYSEANGAFDITDFRKNGLQTLSEALLEHIVMRQFEHNAQYGKYSSNSPVKGSKGIIILPIEAQKKIHGNYLEVGKLAAQTIRDQRVPRDSFYTVDNYQPQIPYEQKIKVSAYMFLWNIGHGAINLENMSQGINDPGHVTTGYPGMSSNYRCLLCNGVRGSRYDGTMVGILDYYFPTDSAKWPSALKNKTFANDDEGKKITQDLAREIFRSLTGRKTVHLELTDEETKAFSDILNEKVDQSFQDFRTQIASLGSIILNLNDNLPTEIFSSVNKQYSLRFILQMAAMRHLAPSKIKGIFKVITEKIFKDNQSASLILQVFHRLVRDNKITDYELKGLMEEHLPVNVLQTKIDNELKDLEAKYDQKIEMFKLQKDVSALVKKYSAPVPFDIVRFAAHFRSTLSDKLSDVNLDRLFFDALRNRNAESLKIAFDKLYLKTPIDIQRMDEWIVALERNYDHRLIGSVKFLTGRRAETFRSDPNANLSEYTLNAILNLSMKTENVHLLSWLITHPKPAVKKRFQTKVSKLLGSSDLPLNHRLCLIMAESEKDPQKTFELVLTLLRTSIKDQDIDSTAAVIRIAGKLIRGHLSKIDENLFRNLIFLAIKGKITELVKEEWLRYVSIYDLYSKPEMFISILYPPFADADQRVVETAFKAILGQVPKRIVNHLFTEGVARFYQAIPNRLSELLVYTNSHYTLDQYLDVIIQAVWKGSIRGSRDESRLAQNPKLMKRFNSKFLFFIESLLFTMRSTPSGLSDSKAILRALILAKKLTPKNDSIAKRMEQADSIEQMFEIAGLKTALTCVQPFSN